MKTFRIHTRHLPLLAVLSVALCQFQLCTSAHGMDRKGDPFFHVSLNPDMQYESKPFELSQSDLGDLFTLEGKVGMSEEKFFGSSENEARAFVSGLRSGQPIATYIEQLTSPDGKVIDSVQELRTESLVANDGADRRSLVTLQQLKGLPFSPVVSIFIATNEGEAFGSGTLVGPSHVLTVGHNVIHKGQATQIHVAVGLTPDTQTTCATAKVTQFSVLDEFLTPYRKRDSQYIHHDMALLTLDRPLGNAYGWLSMKAFTDDTLASLMKKDDIEMRVSGYPGELRTQMKTHAGKLKDFLIKKNPEVYYYTLDTTPGQSGSGVLIKNALVGTHSTGATSYNMACRLTPDKLRAIVDLIQKHAVPLTSISKPLKSKSGVFGARDDDSIKGMVPEKALSSEIALLLKKAETSLKYSKDNKGLQVCINVCNDILSKDHECISAYYLRIECLLGQGNALEALGDCEAALAFAPNDVELYIRKGQCFEKLDNPQEAIDAYEYALSLDGKNALAHCGLGGMLVKVDKVDDALGHFRAAYELDAKMVAAKQGAQECEAALIKRQEKLEQAKLAQEKLAQEQRERIAYEERARQEKLAQAKLAQEKLVQEGLKPEGKREYQLAMRLAHPPIQNSGVQVPSTLNQYHPYDDTRAEFKCSDDNLCVLRALSDSGLGVYWPRLTKIDLSDGNLTDDSLIQLRLFSSDLCPMLIEIRLTGNKQLTSLKALSQANLHQLEKLDVSYCGLTGDGGLDGLKGCENLKELWLGSDDGGNPSLTSLSGLSGLSFSNLETLGVVKCGLTGDGGLSALKGCENLKVLWLGDSGLFAGGGNPSLTSLSGLSGLTFPQLETLYVSCCGLTGDGGLSVLKGCEHLKELGLNRNPSLTSLSGLNGLAFAKLETLYVADCGFDWRSEKVRKSLRKALPRVGWIQGKGSINQEKEACNIPCNIF